MQVQVELLTLPHVLQITTIKNMDSQQFNTRRITDALPQALKGKQYLVTYSIMKSSRMNSSFPATEYKIISQYQIRNYIDKENVQFYEIFPIQVSVDTYITRKPE